MGISKDLIEFLELGNYDEVLDEIEDDMYDDDWELDYDYGEGVSYFTLIKCPSCSRAYNIIHLECGEYIDKCICHKDEMDTVYYCTPCDVIWDTSTNEMLENFSQENYESLSLFDDDDEAYYNSADPYSPEMQKLLKGEDKKTNKWDVYQNNKSSGVITTTKSTTYNYKTCKHKHDEIKLYDGTSIFCSAVRDHAEGLTDPDFGLYADASWKPLWRNEFITWPDYNIPTNEELGLTQIYEAFWRAKNGEKVEIGCIGGHGRTGTILAIMYIASAEGEIDGSQAYKFVKENYCSHAIESDIQEWYIKYASAFWYGTELPDKPVAKTTTNMFCNITDHYAMMLRGHRTCSNKGDQCRYWSQDAAAYNRKDKHAGDITNFYNALPKTRDYDYVYGGLVRYKDDDETNGCSPLDHYTMITMGHEECIRLPGECSFWDGDVQEWNQTGSIGKDSDWNGIDSTPQYKALTKIYPTVEELEVLKQIQEIVPDETIFLDAPKESKKDKK